MGFRINWQKTTYKILTYLFALLIVLIIVLPFYWLVTSSIKEPREIYAADQTLFPKSFRLSAYERLFTQSKFFVYYRNSALVAIGTVITTLFLSISAGYGLGRLRFRGRKTISRAVVISYLFPGIVLLIPMYIFMSMLKLADSILGLIIVYTTILAPYCTWLLRAYFSAIPKDLEDAALVDGANRLRVVTSIFLPLARPGILATAIYIFIMSWSEYMFAFVMITSDTNRTISLGLAAWLADYNLDMGVLAAGAVMTALPVLFFFLFIGRTFVSGMLGGAVKG